MKRLLLTVMILTALGLGWLGIRHARQGPAPENGIADTGGNAPASRLRGSGDTNHGLRPPAKPSTDSAARISNPTPQVRHAPQFRVGDEMVGITIVDFPEPIAVHSGERLNSGVAPWADAYSHSLPAMADNYEQWKRFVTPEMVASIAPTESDFRELQRQGRLQQPCELLYTVEADAEGMRILYLVFRARAVPGAPLANGIKLFKWLDGSWRSHAEDDLGLTGRMSISNRSRLDQLLAKGSL